MEHPPLTPTAAPPASPVDAPPAEAPRPLLCPGCGYDLRGTASERCSECGLVIDRAALRTSGFPWAHRAKIGRVRAFWRTVWVVAADGGTLRYEPAKPQSPRHAAAFRRTLGGVLAVCFGVGVVMLVESGAIADAVVRHSPQRSGPAHDLIVPWSAGVTLRPALFAYAAGLAFYVARATRPIFRTRDPSPDYADTVESIGSYAAAPLAFLLPATAGGVASYALDLYDEFGPRPGALGPVLVTATVGFLIAAVALTVYRTGQWRARTAHAGYPTGFGGMGELLVRWAAGAVLILGVFPWCVGFAWIVFDSFRH